MPLQILPALGITILDRLTQSYYTGMAGCGGWDGILSQDSRLAGPQSGGNVSQHHGWRSKHRRDGQRFKPQQISPTDRHRELEGSG